MDEWSMVQFLPCDPGDTDTIEQILVQVDTAIQYHDDVEPRLPRHLEQDADDDDDDLGRGPDGEQPDWAKEVFGFGAGAGGSSSGAGPSGSSRDDPDD